LEYNSDSEVTMSPRTTYLARLLLLGIYLTYAPGKSAAR
jgi:hypothetical protein